MKILIISNLYPPLGFGGYEKRCKETADELMRRGHDVSILTSNWSDEASRIEENVHRLLFYNPLGDPRKTKNSDQSNFLKRYYQFFEALNNRKNYTIAQNLIKMVKPDLVFAWNMAHVGVAPIMVSQVQKIPVAFSVGDYWLLNLKKRLCSDDNPIKRKYNAIITGLDNFNQLNTRHLLAISTALKRTYVDNGFPTQNIEVIPRGISSSLLLPIENLPNHSLTPGHDRHLKLLFVGRLVPEKGPDDAISALGILKYKYGISSIRLDIVGEGRKEYVSTLNNLVLDLALKGAVNFIGKQEHSSVMSMYENYDALLFPSRWQEPLGGTILEAMARGLPVIVSKRGGPLDIIQDEVNGLLVPVNEPTKLAEAALRLFQDRRFAHRLRLNALNTIRENYTLERIVDRTLDYFRLVLN